MSEEEVLACCGRVEISSSEGEGEIHISDQNIDPAKGCSYVLGIGSPSLFSRVGKKLIRRCRLGQKKKILKRVPKKGV